MPYLIDGHNLIGKVPNLRQDDPEDEKQLIEMLQEFCQRTGKYKEVYFADQLLGKMTRMEESDGPKLDKNEVADWLRLLKMGKMRTEKMGFPAVKHSRAGCNSTGS